MFSRNLSVLDFVRRFFVSCAQISEAYGDEIRVRLAEDRPQRQVQERPREDIKFFFTISHENEDVNVKINGRLVI